MFDFFYYNALNILSLLILTILFLHSFYTLREDKEQRKTWLSTLIFLICAIAFDMVSFSINGILKPRYIFWHHFSYIGLFIFVTFLARGISLFFYHSIKPYSKEYSLLKKLFLIPTIINSILLLLNLELGFLFTISEQNVYARASLFVVINALAFVQPLIIVAIIALKHRDRVNAIFKNNRFLIVLILSTLSLSIGLIVLQEHVTNITIIFTAMAPAVTVIHLILISNTITTDYLTQLSNKLGVEKYFNKMPKKIEGYLAVVFFDLDNFKGINDTYGHKTGDILLKNFANILLRELKHKDLAARMGGDEFLIALVTKKENDINFVLESILAETKNHNEEKGICINYSYGVSVLKPDEDMDYKKLIENSDSNMYKQKNMKKAKIKTK